MDYIIIRSDGSEALYHHGIKGQKWGVRKYQNPDGTLTPAGQKRYDRITKKQSKIDKQISENAAERQKKINMVENISSTVNKPKLNFAKDFAKNHASSKYDQKEVELKWKKAKLEAKKNKDYKNSDEYKRIKQAYVEDYVDFINYGERGSVLVKTLKKYKTKYEQPTDEFLKNKKNI